MQPWKNFKRRNDGRGSKDFFQPVLATGGFLYAPLCVAVGESVKTMTEDSVNVLLMIAPVIASAALLVRLHIREADVVQGAWKKQFGWGIAGLLAFGLLFPALGEHKCANGQPYPQMLVGLAAVLPVFLFVRQGRSRILAATVIILLVQLPVSHYNRLVHGGHFIGTKEVQRMIGVRSDKVPVRAVPLWHTWLTHLYGLETKPRTEIVNGVPADEPLQTMVRYEALQERDGVLYRKDGGDLFTGVCQSFYENGQRRDEIHVRAGRWHGPMTIWHNNGRVFREAIYVEGKRQGTQTEWDEAGRKVAESNFDQGIKQGLQIQWGEDGHKIAETGFDQGLKHGADIEWYADGQKSREGHYVHGKKHGLFCRWYRNGQKAVEASCVDGATDGTVTDWYPDGTVRTTDVYEHGKKTKARR